MPVKVFGCRKISDVYKELLEFQKSGRLVIKPNNEVSPKIIAYIESTIKKDIEEKDLKKQTRYRFGGVLQGIFSRLMR